MPIKTSKPHFLTTKTHGPYRHRVKLSAMKRVYAIKDQDGHWYVIPYELKEEFLKMEAEGESDEWEAFIDKFDKYRTGGDLNRVTLYAEIV